MYNEVNAFEGFGEIEELKKAIDTGNYAYAGPPGDLTQGAAWQVESLDATLRNVTFKMKNLKLWPDIPKSQAYNVVEEYNLEQAHGGDVPFFNGDGELPAETDFQVSREIAQVKFMGTRREVTHPATLVRPAHEPLIAHQIKTGTMHILGRLERALFKADSALQALEFDGIETQIRGKSVNAEYIPQEFLGFGAADEVVIDCRGSILTEDLLEEGANNIAENFGFPSDLYLGTRQHSDLSKQFYPKERIPNMGQADGKAGFVLSQFVSSAGIFDLKGNVFNRPRLGPVAGGAGAAPTAPAAVDSTEAVNAEWLTADQGDYIYAVSAVYRQAGESAAVVAAAYTKANDNNVDISWTAAVPAAGDAVSHYNVFRSAKDGDATTLQLIGRTAGNVVTLRDLNAKLPGSAEAYLMQVDAENVMWKQLAPLMKMDLAIVAPAYRWMQLLYGTPIVYTPRKNVVFENIGIAPRA